MTDSELNWHKYFLDMCSFVASKSKDRSTKVGAIIVGSDNEIRSTGYNGFPRLVDDSIDSRHERPDKYLWTIHAEQNAILEAARIGIALKGSKIYVDLFPCALCAGFIIQAGISEVIVDGRKKEEKKEVYKRFEDNIKISKQMFSEANINSLFFNGDEIK